MFSIYVLVDPRIRASRARSAPPSAEAVARRTESLRRWHQDIDATAKAERAAKITKSKGSGPIVDQNGTIYNSQRDAARKLNLSPGNVSSVLSGRYSQIGGYTFRYLHKEDSDG